MHFLYFINKKKTLSNVSRKRPITNQEAYLPNKKQQILQKPNEIIDEEDEIPLILTQLTQAQE